VLYELLDGRRAFTGTTAIETLHAILTSDPPEITGTASAASVFGAERIIRRCLEKDPVQRFQSARDLAFALEQTADSRSSTTSTIPSTSGALNWPWIAALVVVAAGATTVGTYLAGGWSQQRGGRSPAVHQPVGRHLGAEGDDHQRDGRLGRRPDALHV
jgi:eukaryotic-like serine/threonine-protein kinase